jgi:diadenosine tetraphosphatase ApaH/serine/threonine PP2A family protein phosphatase
MMWSDPEDISEPWVISPRGAGYLFGSKVTREFNHVSEFAWSIGCVFGLVVCV